MRHLCASGGSGRGEARRVKSLLNLDPRRIGVFGGTFDPVHYGHLVCAEQLREALGLDLVLFVPSARPPHKPGYRPTAAGRRISMLRLATRGRRGFMVSGLEAGRAGISYTVDTVRELRRLLGRGVELWLLLGTDAYLDMATWKDPREITRECRLGVAVRPGYSAGGAGSAGDHRARFFAVNALDISATDIRARLRAGRSIAFLVPPEVETYIRRHGLYGARARKGRPCRRRAGHR